VSRADNLPPLSADCPEPSGSDHDCPGIALQFFYTYINNNVMIIKDVEEVIPNVILII